MGVRLEGFVTADINFLGRLQWWVPDLSGSFYH